MTKPMVSPRRTSPARRLLATTHLLHYCYHPLTLRTYLLLTPCYPLPTCHVQLEHSLAGGGVLTSDGLPQAPLAFYVVHIERGEAWVQLQGAGLGAQRLSVSKPSVAHPNLGQGSVRSWQRNCS